MTLSIHQASACEDAIEQRDLAALRGALRTENPNALRLGGFGMTLLHLAVETFAPAIPVLLEHGMNPLTVDTDGKTAFDWCNEHPVPESIERALLDAMQRQRQADEAQVLRSAMAGASPVPAPACPTASSRPTPTVASTPTVARPRL